MYSIIVGLIIFVSVLLIIVVLVQNSKGGGLSSQFGGNSSNQFMGVQKTNDLLEKATWTLAITLIVLILASNFAIDRPNDNLQTTKGDSSESTFATEEFTTAPEESSDSL